MMLVWAALALGACGSERNGSVTAPAADLATLGKNLAGETCQMRRRADGPRGAEGQAADITCGKGTGAVGALSTAPLPAPMPAEGAERREAIERALKSSPAGADIAARMTCGSGQWLTAEGGGEALLMPCSLKEGNWPQIVLAAGVGQTLYVAEGLPVLLPVLEQAIAGASGAPLRFADDALKRPLPVFRAADFADYRDLMRLGRLYNSRQDFAAAEDAERRALDIQTRLFGEASPGVGEALTALALDVSNQGRFDEADALFRRAEIIVERSPSALDRGRLASYRALDAANRGRYGDALRLAREATLLRRSSVTAALDQPTDPALGFARASENGEVAHSLIIEAAMALRVGDLPQAESAATEALRVIVDTPGLPLWWRAEALMMMGDINAREARFAAAQQDYRDALAFRQRLFGDTAPTAFAYMKLARLYEREELYPAAIETFRSALAILSRDRTARSELTADQVTPFIAAASKLAVRDAAESASLQDDVFRTSQLLNSGVAAQTVAKASARLAIGDAAVAELLRQEQEAERRRDSARVELAGETAKPDSERNVTREARLAAEMTEASAAADTLLQRLQQQFPAYGKLVEPGAVTLAELRGKLRGDEALLSFVIGRDRSYALLVRADHLAVRQIELDEATLAADVAELRQAFAPRAGALAAYDLRAAFALYRKLLGPLADELAGANHLIVVAEGPLASLPLGLLVEQSPPAGGEHDYRKAAWLLRRLAISEVPSVRAFVALRAAPRPASATSVFLGFGDPAFGGPAIPGAKAERASALDRLATECRDDAPVPARLLREMAPLPETANEVQTIARLLGADPGSVVLGAAATEAGFRSRHPERYRVLYFATHGLLPGELRCRTEPALVLSPPPVPAATKAEDGLLEASEIAGLKLDAELVVLSACNTAAPGGRFGGEALSGLAEAFFYAGARTLVASHWQVPSAATARLMTGVFERLGPDLSRGVAESLRRSQLELLDQPATAHPFYWAAFTVIGDGGPHAPAAVAQTASGR